MALNPIDLLGYLDDVSETIANPNPDRPFSNAIGENGRRMCRAWSAAPQWARDLTGPARSVISLTCKPYLDGLGYSDPEFVNPGFTGGQCAGVQYIYRVTSASVSRRGCPGPFFNVTANNTPFDIGPVVGPITKIEGKAFDSPTFFCASLGATHKTGAGIFVTGASGTASRVVTPGDVQADVLSVTWSGTLIRVDGLPDTCGNPPESVEPGPNPDPSPPTIPPGEEPFEEEPGRPFLPIPPIELPTFPDVDVQNPFEPGGGGGSPTDLQPQPGEDIEGEGGGSGGGDNPFGEPPDGTRWCGACITLTATPEGLGVIPSSIPENVYAEVVGNARLYVENDSQSTYDTPVQLRSKTVCCWEPVRGLRPVGLRVNLKPNFFYTVTPYYVPLET